MKSLLPFFLLLSFCSSVGAQSTHYVPDDFSTIQLAIDGSVNGDTVIVRDGTYLENINFNGRAITLKSENGPGTTIIDGNQAGSVVVFDNGEGIDSVFEGFTVTNGSSTSEGGGIYCFDTSPTIINNTIDSNSASKNGGGIYTYHGQAVIKGNQIYDNNAGFNGGGICCYGASQAIIELNYLSGNDALLSGGAIYGTFASPIILNNDIDANSAGGSGGAITCSSGLITIRDNYVNGNTSQNSGAISLSGCSGEVTNNTITSNSCTGRGGGISLSDSSLLISQNTINGNTAGTGGGINMWGFCDPILTGNLIDSNIADSVGGGIHIREYSNPVIRDNTITNNQVLGLYGDGGGIAGMDASAAVIINNTIDGNFAYSGGGIYWNNASWYHPIIESNTITNNSATRGGGISVEGVGAPIRNNYIANNTASGLGGGAYIKSETMIGNVILQNTASSGGGGIAIAGNSSPSIEDCIIAKNEAFGGGTGGGIYSYTSSNPSIKSCTVTENVAYSGGGIFVLSSSATIDNSIVWGNSALSDPELSISLAGGSFTVSYSDIGGGWTGSGNIDADPLFQSGLQGDYYLSQRPSGQLSNSPCRNAGMPGLPLPASTTRSDGMGDTNILDMGYHYPLGPPTLVVENLIASQQATFRTEGGHPGAKVYFCYSLAGQGPIFTPLGFILNLTPPTGGGPNNGWNHFANSNGEASMTVTIPSGAAGVLVWLQVVESLSGTFRVSNLVATTVQ